jgi:hypothetical protein
MGELPTTLQVLLLVPQNASSIELCLRITNGRLRYKRSGQAAPMNPSTLPSITVVIDGIAQDIGVNGPPEGEARRVNLPKR